jgi:DNA-binding CsgD family transcriptional regulator
VNPWKLTPAEAEVRDALCEIGVDKSIARHLGKSHKTVAYQLRSIREKMGVNRVLSALMWDRYRRANAQG